MRSAVPGEERDSRPPVALHAASTPGSAGRRSVWRRSIVVPRLLEDGAIGFPAAHPFVRRFWTAAVGPGAVADLLRLMAAARSRRSLPLPYHVRVLATVGLVWHAEGTVWVRPTVPPLGGAQLRNISPALRAEHRVEVDRLASGSIERESR